MTVFGGGKVPITVMQAGFVQIMSVVILNKILFALCFCELAETCELLKLSKKDRRSAILLFIFNPASVFFHSVYTQSLYSFLTFRAIKLSFRKKNRYITTLYLSVSILVRSTAMFLLPIVGLDILMKFFSNLRKVRVKKVINLFFKGSSILLIVLAPFILYLLWAYKRICHTGECLNHFNVYSYVQAKHWNVGFLTYYTPQNLMFILLGCPALVFSVFSLRNMKVIKKKKGLILSFCLLLLVIVFYTNIQSSTRFLCSHPVFYVLLSKEIHRPLIRYWQVSYYLLGMILFTVGFPWT